MQALPTPSSSNSNPSTTPHHLPRRHRALHPIRAGVLLLARCVHRLHVAVQMAVNPVPATSHQSGLWTLSVLVSVHLLPLHLYLPAAAATVTVAAVAVACGRHCQIFLSYQGVS